MLARRIEVLKVSRDVADRTRESIGDVNRKHLLREQMRTIQKELGEGDENATEIAELEEAITKARMPEEVEKAARKELRRLERMPEAAGEYSMVRTYLDWLIELPWDIDGVAAHRHREARRILDEDHFGLEKIKRRILEHLAVHKLNPTGRSPILCFVGPPGVGKTSLGQSIAKATQRTFARVSLGGVHDEAEIRGHRRTYIGALPGNIIQSLRKAGRRDCVMMLDEVDKLGAGGFHGDPASALLEVLDPEQNATFRDTYLAVPFDLSKVMFICTANVLETIPGPLRDRMEVIQLPGYTAQEKLQIARRYLLPRQLAATA
jgi:ATP-dependent Lon protease